MIYVSIKRKDYSILNQQKFQLNLKIKIPQNKKGI